MTGPLAADAEVFRCFDQSRTKDHLPKAIDRYARRKRMTRIDEPPRQSQTILCTLDWQPTELCRHCRLNFLAKRPVIATNQHMRRPALRHISHYANLGN